MSVGDVLLTWDTCQIAKWHAEELKETGDERSEEEIRNQVCCDTDLFTMEWERLLERLDEIVKERNPRNVWYAEVYNFGWRELGGWGTISAETAKELLGKILPQTDCTFKIYAYGDHGLAINNAHHDSPMWKEWYYLEPGLSEALVDDAIFAATDAVLLVAPDLKQWDVADSWDWYKGELTFLESDDEEVEKVSKAALLAGGMAFRELIRAANVEVDIDLSSLSGPRS